MGGRWMAELERHSPRGLRPARASRTAVKRAPLHWPSMRWPCCRRGRSLRTVAARTLLLRDVGFWVDVVGGARARASFAVSGDKAVSRDGAGISSLRVPTHDAP